MNSFTALTERLNTFSIIAAISFYKLIKPLLLYTKKITLLQIHTVRTKYDVHITCILVILILYKNQVERFICTSSFKIVSPLYAFVNLRKYYLTWLDSAQLIRYGNIMIPLANKKKSSSSKIGVGNIFLFRKPW